MAPRAGRALQRDRGFEPRARHAETKRHRDLSNQVTRSPWRKITGDQMNLFKRLLYLATLLVLLLAGAAAAQPIAGRDYTLINPPQPIDSGKKIEVLEFFWYGCIHCYNLETPPK